MKNLSHEEIASLCLELSLLLHAGVGLSDALALLGEEAGRENRALLESMARRMDEGSTLAAAMREEGCFPAYVWGLVEVGERSGRTEEALAGPGTMRNGSAWTGASAAPCSTRRSCWG